MLCQGVPIGYIQAYRYSGFPDFTQHLALGEDAAGLDLFIGEPAYVHRGWGRYVLASFLRSVTFADASVPSCVVLPEPENSIAICCYEKTGFPDTPLGLKPSGFSVPPRRHPRESPKGLPRPLNGHRRVLVAVHDQPAGGADMRAHAQALAHVLATPTAVLGRVRWRYGVHARASVCCFAREDDTEGRPAGVGEGRVQASLRAGPVGQGATVPVR
jgi:hypothetical protein